jgi:CubicO group peptidase (beta-lactamase class C family)
LGHKLQFSITRTLTLIEMLRTHQNRRFSLIVALILLTGVPKQCWADDASVKSAKPDFSRVAEILERAIGQHAFPGCAVAIGNHERVLWTHGFGKLDYADGPKPTPETLYDLASITKIIGTTSVVLTLVRDGKLAVTDPVSKCLPEFLTEAKDQTDRDRKAKVTIEHLMTHSSGLPAEGQSEGKPLWKSANTYHGLIKLALTTPMDVAPGERTEYSDLGMILLGEAASRAGGKPLAELEQERVFKPLGLHETMRNPPASLLDRIAPTEQRADGMGFWRGVVHDENARAAEGLTAHAGIFSTADDMARWCTEWLKGARGESDIFPKKLVEQFTRRREIVKGSTRALGWDTPPGSQAGKKLSPHSFGHTGFTGTSVYIDPDADLYIVLLTNAVHPKRGGRGVLQVRREVDDAAIETMRP